MKVAFYVRVSTDDQTIENQIKDLQAAAAIRDWDLVEIYRDEGISGAKGRDGRPAFNKLLEDAAAQRFNLIAAWSVDRLGRSLKDLIGFLEEIRSAGIELYLHKQNLDTSTPAGQMLFSILGAIGEFERTMIAARVKAGMSRARGEGRHMGRPVPTPELIRDVKQRKIAGDSAEMIAGAMGFSTRTVWRFLRM